MGWRGCPFQPDRLISERVEVKEGRIIPALSFTSHPLQAALLYITVYLIEAIFSETIFDTARK